MVRPLSLALEAGSDGVMADGFFNEACGQVLVALDQILDDAVHLDREFPLLLFFFLCKLDAALFAEEVDVFGVVIAAFLAVLLRPGQCLFIGLMVVDALFHAAEDLDLVNGLHAQAQILLHEVLIHDGAADAHGDGADLQIALAPHRRDCDSGTAEAQQLFLHVVGDFRDLVAVLHLMAVDAEGGQALLGVGRQNRGQIHSARTLGAVEAPDALDGHGVHIHRLGAVAPAGGNGQGDGDALALEFLGAGSGFRHAADGGVSHDDLHGLAVGIVQIFLKQLLRGLGHGHDLIFQTLAQLHRAAAAINDGADADYGVFADITILSHTTNSFTLIECHFIRPSGRDLHVGKLRLEAQQLCGRRVAREPRQQQLCRAQSHFIHGLLDNFKLGRNDGAQVDVVIADEIHLVRQGHAALMRSHDRAERHVVVGDEYGGRRLRHIEKGAEQTRAGFEIVVPGGNERLIDRQTVIRQHAAIAHGALPRGGNGLRACDKADAAVSAADQMLNGHIDRVQIVDHDGIILRIFQRPVDQHDRDRADADAKLFGGRVLRDVDDAVDVIARKKRKLAELLLPVKIIAAYEAFIAAAPQNQLQRRDHAAKKGT